MAQKILLINPAKKPSQRRKKKRTAAQIRATKKLVAMNKRRAKAKRKTNPVKKRTKPMAAQKRRKTRRTAAQRAATRKLVALNKRRRRGGAKRKRNPISRRRRAYRATPTMRRNPIRRRRRRNPIGNGVVNKVMLPALTAAGGALAIDAMYGYLPIPVNIKNGPMKHLVKAGVAVLGLYYGGKMVVKKSTAEQLAMGALTVIAHQAGREAIARFAPQIQMDGMGYYSAGLPAGGYDMGLYVADKPAISAPAAMMNEYDEMGLYVA